VLSLLAYIPDKLHHVYFMFTTVLAVGPHKREIYKMPRPHTTPHDEEFLFLTVHFTAASHMYLSQELKSEHKVYPQNRTSTLHLLR